MLWNKVDDLQSAGNGAWKIENGKLIIKDEHHFRNQVERLIYNAIFNDDDNIKKLSRWIIWEASLELNSPAASINDFYMARASDSWKDVTVPAINIRCMTYDVARTAFKVLNRHNAAACLFEIARSEMSYTGQDPEEYAICILAAAIRENYKCPVFIQGDHFQAKLSSYLKNPESEVAAIKTLISKAIDAGFYNIDIDTSTLVDLDCETIEEQQKDNFEIAAELTKHIRSTEPKGITVSIGGEIGEVGGKNSTPEELKAFLNGYNNNIGEGLVGLSKVSVQTGTSHGGVPLPDGSIAKVKLDFGTLEELGRVARDEFKIGGVVQHGASTLPEAAFDNFPNRQTLEVHLATAFQNLIYDSTSFPRGLKEQIYTWLDQNCADERKPDQTSEQFYYKTRKKVFGPFKKKFWTLPDNTKQTLMSELSRTFEMMFMKLNIQNSKDVINKIVKPVLVHKSMPL